METIKKWLKKMFALLGIGTRRSRVVSTPSQRKTYVYVTTKGKKFHYDLLCPGIRHSKEIKMDISKARKAGYTACDKCCHDYLHE